MRASSKSPETARRAADRHSLPASDRERAPDLAWTCTEIAGLGAGARICRLERPLGAVRIVGAAGLTIGVRINLLARMPTPGLGAPLRLKQCMAPDYFVIVPAKQSVMLAAHDAQLILRLELAPALLATLVEGAPRFGRLAGKLIADGFITGIAERVHASAADAAHAEHNAGLIRALLLSLQRMDAQTLASADRGGLTARQLATVREHVETGLDRALPTAQLAALVGLSPFHFARAFKQSMGATPAAWIRLRRLSVAQRLLTHSALSITDVAAAVGYESPSRFARAFRAVSGQSPSAFRRRAQLHSASSEPGKASSD